MEGRSGIDSPNAWTYRLNEGDYRKGGKRMATCRIRPVMARKWQGHHSNLQQGLKDTGWDGGHRESHSLQLTPTHHLASMSRTQPSLAPFPLFPIPYLHEHYCQVNWLSERVHRGCRLYFSIHPFYTSYTYHLFFQKYGTDCLPCERESEKERETEKVVVIWVMVNKFFKCDDVNKCMLVRPNVTASNSP